LAQAILAQAICSQATAQEIARRTAKQNLGESPEVDTQMIIAMVHRAFTSSLALSLSLALQWAVVPVMGSLEAWPTQVHYVTWESRREPLISEVGNFPPQVTNLALQRPWRGFVSKINLLVSWLSSGIPDDDLVVAMDGGDVIWGGCSEAVLLSSYRHIVNESGSPIVFSAELTCWEQDCGHSERVKHPHTNDRWHGFTQCPSNAWNNECAARRHCAECGVKPATDFLNSGFFMGPAKQVYAMAQWAQENFEKWTTGGDQSVYAIYWHQNPNVVVLDYMAKLAISLSDVRESALSVQADSTITNNVFGHRQCFIHGNGRGKPLVNRLAQSLRQKAASSFLRTHQLLMPRSNTASSFDTESWFAHLVDEVGHSRSVEGASLLWRGV